MIIAYLAVKHAKAEVSVYHFEDFPETGSRVDVAQSSHYRETIAAKTAVAEVLQEVLSFTMFALVGIEVTRGAAVFPERVAEHFREAFLTKVMHEHGQASVGHLQYSLSFIHMHNLT